MTAKAQVADEVAAAAPLAAALPAAGTAAQPALPTPSAAPSSPKAEGGLALSALQGKAGEGQKQAGDSDELLTAADGKGSKRQKSAGEKAAEGKAQLEDVAKLANELQPTGSTLSTMQVHTKVQTL